MKIDTVYNLQVPSEDDPTKYVIISGAETRKVVDLLESSTLFETTILKIRKKYNIPSKGYQESGTDIHGHLGERYDEFINDCEDLTDKLKLPEYWTDGIKVFALNGVFIAIRRKPVKIIPNPSEDFPFEFWFDLVIAEKISKTEFLEEVEKEWPMIEKYMEDLPKPPKHKMIRSSWAKRIVDLRDIEGKHFKDIADILEKENQGNGSEDVINEDYVKNLYHRWKKLIKSKK